MTLLERGYRRLHYTPTGILQRVWPIALMELKAMFRVRFGAVLYLICLGPTIGSLIFLLVRAGIWELTPQGSGTGGGMGGRMGRGMAGSAIDPSTPTFFLTPIFTLSMVPFLILTTLVTVRAVAKDRAAGALEMYWTRGITPLWYFVGKWGGSFLLLASAFVLAPCVLWLTSVLLAPDWRQFEATIPFVPGMLLGLACVCALLSLLAVSLSALVGTPNFASILWLLLFVGTLVGGQILRFLFKENWVTAINPWRASKRVVEVFAGDVPFFDYSPWAAVGFLGGMVACIFGFALRRLRVAEVVAS